MESRVLPSIIKIESIATEEMELYPVRILAPGKTTSVIAENKEPFRMTEPAGMEITPERTDNGLTYKTKINGYVYDDGDDEIKNRLQTAFHSYIVTDVYRNKFLIGIKEKPFPEIIFTPTNPAAVTDKRVVAFEITWESTLPPVKIVDL